MSLAFGLPFVGAGPAPGLELSSLAGSVGTSVTAVGARLTPLTVGTVHLGPTAVAGFTTDRKGGFSTDFLVPATAGPGATTVVAVMGRLRVSQTFTVTSSTPTGSIAVGVSTPNAPRDQGELDASERDAGTPAGVVMYFQGWAYDEFDPVLAGTVAARGAVPEITWEPWDYRRGLSQPAYALGRIVDGTHDAYVTRWAQGAKA